MVPLIGKRISKNFTWNEVLRSNIANELGISNEPSKFAAANLTRVVYLGLEPVRKHFGRSFSPSSGYRSPTLNEAINGSKTSNHSIGCAIDFEIEGIDNYEVAEWCVNNLEVFDEIILEKYTGGNTGWIHVGIRPEDNRSKVLTWDGQNYSYGLNK